MSKNKQEAYGKFIPYALLFFYWLWGKELPFIGSCGCFWMRVSDLTGAWDWMIVSEREMCYPVYKR